ncbi:uncharacterized protein LOC117108618 [Anneissia japonica]|uniref:uncharacterized protein LOC117108618 n=1 Tax=Anneissia japonica TaxID=1529436 RepID=UPI0014256F9B|nr:uncharacterized protein LOC117108618 [Anneissia japonica]
MRGSIQENEDYCTKDYEWTKISGNIEEVPDRRGQRTDIVQAATMKLEGASPRDLLQNAAYMNNKFAIDLQVKEVQEEETKSWLAAKFHNWQPKRWQQKVIDLCKEEPDDRTIHWYWDKKGGTGKSTLMKYLFSKMNAYVPNQCRSLDIINGYDKQRIVVFDYTRSMEE